MHHIILTIPPNEKQEEIRLLVKITTLHATYDVTFVDKTQRRSATEEKRYVKKIRKKMTF